MVPVVMTMQQKRTRSQASRSMYVRKMKTAVATRPPTLPVWDLYTSTRVAPVARKLNIGHVFTITIHYHRIIIMVIVMGTIITVMIIIPMIITIIMIIFRTWTPGS